MGFEAYRQGTFTKRLADLADQPNMQAHELKAYFDSSPEELRQSFNRLCNALGEFTAAAKMGYTSSASVPANTVQAAIENVQKQVQDAVMGNIPSGSVDGDKLAQDVRDRFSTIERAMVTETNARSSTDANLQQNVASIQTTLAGKTESTFGFYTGDGEEHRTIYLGYRPKAVIVFQSGSYVGDGNAVYGGFASEGNDIMYGDQVGLGITDTGFQVLNYRNCALNISNYKYSYAVFW